MAPAQMVEVKDLPPEMRAPDVALKARALGRPAGKPEADTPAANAPASAPVSVPASVSASLPASLAANLASLLPASSEQAGVVEAGWEEERARAAAGLLSQGGEQVMDQLTRQFEATVIRMALRHTGGRRIEAAHRLGIGRNTITRKIQELGLEHDEGQ